MKKTSIILIISILSILIPNIVDATVYDFSSYEVRKAYNEKKFQEIVNMTDAERNMYKDKYLNDMYETDYKGISSAKQQLIKDLSQTILNDESFTCEESDSENMCKLRKFHDWIKTSFYYYNPDNGTKNKSEAEAKAKALGLTLTEYDNPYYILTKNKITKQVSYINPGDTEETVKEVSHYVARCNGYTSMLVALARNAGMPARAISGYYNTSYRHKTHEDWVKTGIDPDPGNPKENTLSHAWVLVYVDGRWIIIDANADSYNSYSENEKCIFREDDEEMGGTPGNYSKEDCLNSNRYAWGHWVMSSRKYYVKDYDKKYFDISPSDLADSHIIFKYRPGNRKVAYLSNTTELTRLKAFLNKKASSTGLSNGKKINSSYTTVTPKTWFTNPTSSLGDGYGRLYKLYWPAKKGLWGSLNLNDFTALQNVSVPNNKLTYLFMKNCPSLSTVAVANNNIKTIEVTGSKKLTLLSAQGNPTTSVKYNFGTAPKTAIIKAGTGGTVSVKYKKNGTKHEHTMSAFAKKGYKFKGWYKGTTRFSTKYSITKTNTFSFTYTAKFIKR